VRRGGGGGGGNGRQNTGSFGERRHMCFGRSRRGTDLSRVQAGRKTGRPEETSSHDARKVDSKCCDILGGARHSKRGEGGAFA